MSDLSGKEREMLQLLRDEWGPSSQAKAAVRAAVEQRVAQAAAPASSAPPRSLLRSPWVLGSGVVAVGVLLGTLALVRPSAPEHLALPAPQSAATQLAPRPADTAPTTAPTMEAVSVDSLPVARPLASTKSAPSVAAPTADADTLAEELAILRKAQASLRDGAPDEALATLATHASRFPNGVLREERLTLRALALCDRGDVAAARVTREELARTQPGSSHLKRLEGSCAAP